jgi:hypothetical protein
VQLLSCVAECTVTDSLFNTQANCSKCPPSAWIHFLTRVTMELVTLKSAARSINNAAVFCQVTSSLVTQDRKCMQADGDISNNLCEC